MLFPDCPPRQLTPVCGGRQTCRSSQPQEHTYEQKWLARLFEPRLEPNIIFLFCFSTKDQGPETRDDRDNDRDDDVTDNDDDDDDDDADNDRVGGLHMKSPLSPIVADRVGGLPHASHLSPAR